MEVTLPADLRKQVEQELASGRYQSRDELIAQAVRHFLDERQRPAAVGCAPENRSGRRSGWPV